MIQTYPGWINTQSAEFRRFAQVAFFLLLTAFLLLVPGLSEANPASGGGKGFNGDFAPDTTLVTNTSNSLKGWWKAIATWGLWLSIAGFLFSIIFAGGRWWWIPVAVMLICLFGEPAITKVADWAELN